MILRPGTTLESLGVLPALVCPLDAVPRSIILLTPWQDHIVLCLTPDDECELATEGALILPVLHWVWPDGMLLPHPHTLLATLLADVRVPMGGTHHAHNVLLVLRPVESPPAGG